LEKVENQMADYTVKQGDCLSSIAAKYGLFWEKIWNHPKNARLKEQRKDPNILYPGDVVFVPEKEVKEESGATEQRHQFKKKGAPAKLRLRLMKNPGSPQERRRPQDTHYPPSKDLFDEDSITPGQSINDEPIADVPYIAVIDGHISEGQTDSDGKLEITIPPGASGGRLIVEPGTSQEKVIPLCLGQLNPMDTVSGIKQRLANLNFNIGDTSEDQTAAYIRAIGAFQRKYGLEETGELNEQTRQKLKDVHGD